jgi:hypothetical protein
MAADSAAQNIGAAHGSRVRLNDIADAARLRKVWTRSLRSRLRKLPFPDFELGHDPLDYLAFDWDLQDAIATLCRQLQSGDYRASAPEIIRSAKSLGLTRPLAFLQPRDLLAYKAIVSAAEVSLLRNAKPWARFGRADSADTDDGHSPSESGWFREWLKRQGQIWTITDSHAWIVETDIANFFPYIRIESVLEHVLANSRLSEESIHLLSYILTALLPMRGYQATNASGLVQENFDCSRILAHTYLKTLDDEFEKEGNTKRYSRWMDDIVIGADSPQEALQIIFRVQQGLEGLGLYPNTAKTRIIPASYFAIDYMKETNDYLGEVSERYKNAKHEDVHTFRLALRRHMRLRSPRPKAWPRVLRRFYTASRWLRDPTLLPHAFRHIEETPDSARHVFEYLVTFPLTIRRHESLLELLMRLGGVYRDIELLAHEYVCTAPNPALLPLRDQISNWALEVMMQEIDKDPRLAAAACMSVGKFGTSAHLEEIVRQFRLRA